MRMKAKWLTPVLWSVAIVGTAIAAACGDGSASRSVFSVLDSAGRDSVGDSVPRDTTPPPPPPPPPPDTIPPPPPPPPPDTLLAPPIVVSPRSQQLVVGDSGVVSATVRDAAGRDVWPGEITWESSDTSTVLHIRYVGSSFIVFDALLSATARLVARHRDLADTAVVIVR